MEVWLSSDNMCGVDWRFKKFKLNKYILNLIDNKI